MWIISATSLYFLNAVPQFNTYFWWFTEATKKCVLPSLYCFLLDLTRVPPVFNTTAPFSREMLNSSDCKKKKKRVIGWDVGKTLWVHLVNHIKTTRTFWLLIDCRAESLFLTWSVKVTNSRLCVYAFIPRQCDRKEVRWAELFWS